MRVRVAAALLGVLVLAAGSAAQPARDAFVIGMEAEPRGKHHP
jgi:hypothetical protein